MAFDPTASSSPSSSSLSANKGAISDLLTYIDRIYEDDDQLKNLSNTLSSFTARLPMEFYHENQDLDFSRHDTMQHLIVKAKDILIPKLLAKGRKA